MPFVTEDNEGYCAFCLMALDETEIPYGAISFCRPECKRQYLDMKGEKENK